MYVVVVLGGQFGACRSVDLYGALVNEVLVVNQVHLVVFQPADLASACCSQGVAVFVVHLGVTFQYEEPFGNVTRTADICAANLVRVLIPHEADICVTA